MHSVYVFFSDCLELLDLPPRLYRYMPGSPPSPPPPSFPTLNILLHATWLIPCLFSPLNKTCIFILVRSSLINSNALRQQNTVVTQQLRAPFVSMLYIVILPLNSLFPSFYDIETVV